MSRAPEIEKTVGKEATHGERGALFGLTALAVLLGMQSFRVFLPLLAFLLRDRFGWLPLELGILALGVFGVAFLSPWTLRPLGLRRSLWWTLGSLAVARIGVQLWTGDPVVDLVLSSFGLAAFVLATPLLVLMARSTNDRPAAADTLALGWILGLLADVVLHSAYGSWDLAWRDGVVHLSVAVALALGTFLYLWSMPRDLDDSFSLPDAAGAWAWFGVWPLMFLYVSCFGLTARVEALPGMGHEAPALMAVALAVAAGPWRKLPEAGRVGVITLSNLFLVLITAYLDASPPPDGFVLVFGLMVLGILLSFLVRRAASGDGEGPSRWLTLGHGFGLLFFLVLTFGTTSAWEVPMPLPARSLPILAAVVATACAFGAGVAGGVRPAAGRMVQFSSLGVWVLAGAFVPVLPTHFPGTESPAEVEGKAWPLRVVTYNVHCGVDPEGRLDLEALAETLQGESPDVVILQEVSRGWPANGGVDVAEYLSHRLGMPYLFHGTADATWGNAVLTRLPVTRVERHPLPPRTLLLRRGYLDVELEVGDDRLRILATHLHHPQEGGEERLVQSRKMVEAWDGTSRTLLAGDLNALPGEPEIELLRDAGLRDALDLAGDGDGFTFPSWNPVRRIDYIWLSSDLTATEAWVSPSRASDHAAVAAVVEPKGSS